MSVIRYYSNCFFKVFARAIHALGRIGIDIFLQATKDGLSLRTVNAVSSAFANLTFMPQFFDEFHLTDSEDQLANTCKLSLKSCLGVFRNMKQVDTQFEG